MNFEVPYIEEIDGIRLSKKGFKQDYSRLRNKSKELSTKYKEIQILIEYPLEKPTILTIKSTKFTLGKLAKKIHAKYLEIYKNKKHYGVWGHDLSDLVLVGIKRIGRSNRYRIVVDS